MHQPAPGKPHTEPNITIKGQRLKVVEKLTYLGSTLSKSIVVDNDVNTRLAKVSATFGRLNRNMWNWRSISEATKIKVYRAVFITTLLYGCETWITYQRHIKKLNNFHTTCLRNILGITWQKHIPDTEVLTRTSLLSIYTILMQSQLRWASHAVHIKNHHLPKKMLHGDKRSQRNQKKRFKDTMMVSMKSFGVTPNCLELQDRDKWYEVVRRGAKVFEVRRNAATELRRKLRKGTATAAIIPCSRCSRLFRAQIGLICHLHTHGSRLNHKVDQMVVFDYSGQRRILGIE